MANLRRARTERRTERRSGSCLAASAAAPALALLLLGLGGVAIAKADKGGVTIAMRKVSPDGIGAGIGTIVAKQAKDGVTLQINLKGLPPGEHGFHLHEIGSCAPGEKGGKKVAALAAGGHFDPDHADAHKGPGGGGHQGDLPKLVVSDKGTIKQELEVQGLMVDNFRGAALVIHAGGDNYSDTPSPLGGGGDRIACGVGK